VCTVLATPTVVARAARLTAAASSLILRDIIEGLDSMFILANR
jgi:hypothetical protein